VASQYARRCRIGKERTWVTRESRWSTNDGVSSIQILARAPWEFSYAMTRDRLSKGERSALMGRIGPRNTSPEKVVRGILRRLGYRFGLHKKDLPGTPDIVLSSRRLAIFVHGCFWHRHTGCSRATTPKNNSVFWLKKFAANVARDSRVRRELRKLGWATAVLWECQTNDRERLTAKLDAVIKATRRRTTVDR
jgi:DNA mismatch endonuclease (patch repair protein)